MIVLQFYNLEKNIDLVFNNIIQLMMKKLRKKKKEKKKSTKYQYQNLHTRSCTRSTYTHLYNNEK